MQGLQYIGPILSAFFLDSRLWTILGLIALDVVTGIMAALKLGTFDWQKVFTFYRTNVVPGVLGYAVVWLFAAFGVAPTGGEILALLANVAGFSAVVASLTASIYDNVRRYTAPVVQPEVSEMYARPPVNPQG